MLEQNIKGVVETLERYPFPRDVVVETIAKCNLRCVMCPQSKLKRPKGEMSFGLFKNIVNEVVAENSDTRIWPSLMGEITMLGQKGLAMIKYASDAGARIHFNTNGNLITEDYADRLIDASPREIIFGIDAVTAETYSKIRVGGNYQMVVNAAEYILKHKKPFQKIEVQFIEMKENAHEMEAFRKLWLNRGAVVKLRPKLGWGNRIKTDYLTIPEEKRVPCGWLMRTCTVSWSGKMLQCDSDCEGENSPGDANRSTIKEVWNGELAKRRERHWEGDFSYLCCKDCKDWQHGRSYYYYPENKQ
ncbi:MAG: radical SAM/SPASM domain-containing protein [Planctomycetota bacterium]